MSDIALVDDIKHQQAFLFILKIIFIFIFQLFFKCIN